MIVRISSSQVRAEVARRATSSRKVSSASRRAARSDVRSIGSGSGSAGSWRPRRARRSRTAGAGAIRAHRNGDRAATQPPTVPRPSRDGRDAARGLRWRPIRPRAEGPAAASPTASRTRCTTRASSTMPAASASSRTPADGRGRRSCRSPWPGSARSAIAARSLRTARRATAAGVLLPLEPSVLAQLAPGRRRPARRRVRCSCPGRPRGATRPAAIVEAALAEERLPAPRLADGPRRPGRARSRGRRDPPGLRPGDRRASGRPVRRPVRAPARPRPAADGGGRAAPARSSPAFAVPSASCRTVVYKGLVAGDRLAELYPDLGVGPDRSATRSSTSAMPPTPIPTGGWPSRSGRSPTTARSTRSGRTASRSTVGRPIRSGAPGSAARRLVEAGPLLSPDGSDSLSLDEALELAVATGWSLEAALLALIPEAVGAPADSGHPLAGAFARRTAGFLAPWDGPAALVFGDGRRVGALVDRNGLRPLAFAITRDRVVAAASEAGRGAARGGRDDPPRPARAGRAAARRPAPRGDPRGCRGEDGDPAPDVAPGRAAGLVRRSGRRSRGRRRRPPRRPSSADGTVGSTTLALRLLAGLDAERARLDIRTMVLEAKEPLWSMGDDTPTPGPGADRPAGRRPPPPGVRPGDQPADRPRARAGGDGPPRRAGPPTRAARRDPDRAADRPARPAGGGRPRRSRSARSVARRVRRLDATWDPADGPAGLASRARPAGRPRRCWRSSPARSRPSSCPTRATRLTGCRSRASWRSAPSTPPCRRRARGAGPTSSWTRPTSSTSTRMAMAIAAGATAVHPRLAIELAAELAGARGAESLERGRRGRPAARCVRGGTAQDPRPDGHLGGRVVRRRDAVRDARARARGRRAVLPVGRGLAGHGRLRGARPIAACAG